MLLKWYAVVAVAFFSMGLLGLYLYSQQDQQDFNYRLQAAARQLRCCDKRIDKANAIQIIQKVHQILGDRLEKVTNQQKTRRRKLLSKSQMEFYFEECVRGHCELQRMFNQPLKQLILKLGINQHQFNLISVQNNLSWTELAIKRPPQLTQQKILANILAIQQRQIKTHHNALIRSFRAKRDEFANQLEMVQVVLSQFLRDATFMATGYEYECYTDILERSIMQDESIRERAMEVGRLVGKMGMRVAGDDLESEEDGEQWQDVQD